MVIDTLLTPHTDKMFAVTASSIDVGEPQLPRKRRVPQRFEDGLSSGEFHEHSILHYRQVYYEALDNIISFQQDGV